MSHLIRKCKLCSKEFVALHHNTKLCSDECKKVSDRKTSRAASRKWKNQNRNKIKDYYLATREKSLERSAKYHAEHQKERCNKRRERYKLQKTKVAAQVKAYKSVPENRLKINNARKKRLKSNTSYSISNRLSCRLYKLLDKNNISKTLHTLDLIGCSLDQLKHYLESQFKDGMTWENKGQWHIDHIRPCASFDLTDPIQQKACFNYTNLQPLWSKDNCSKGAKWTMNNQLCIGDRVKYKQTFLDCWKGKDLTFYKARRGTLVKVLGMGGLVHWDNDDNIVQQEQGIFDLEKD